MFARPFADADQDSLLSDFECGQEIWAADMADWIKGPRVRASIASRGTLVRLYLETQSKVVGFGSYGPAEWAFPEPHDPKLAVTIIPAMAVASEFQKLRLPDGRKLSEAILSDLIAAAQALSPEVLVLTVHKDNVKAQRLYVNAGFQFLKAKRGENLRMFLNLRV